MILRGNILSQRDKTYKTVYSIIDAASTNSLSIQTATVLFRKSFAKRLPDSIRYMITSSHFLFMQLAENGNIGFIKEKMSAYRKHSGGIYSSKSKMEKELMALKNIKAMLCYFSHNPTIKDLLKSKYHKKCLKTSKKYLFKLNFPMALFFLIKLSNTNTTGYGDSKP